MAARERGEAPGRPALVDDAVTAPPRPGPPPVPSRAPFPTGRPRGGHGAVTGSALALALLDEALHVALEEGVGEEERAEQRHLRRANQRRGGPARAACGAAVVTGP